MQTTLTQFTSKARISPTPPTESPNIVAGEPPQTQGAGGCSAIGQTQASGDNQKTVEYKFYRNSVLIGNYCIDYHQCPKALACFDLDGTLITTKSGKAFPVNPNDWKWKFAEMPGLLKRKLNERSCLRYTLVIISNQKHVNKTSLEVHVAGLRHKLSDVASQLGIPFISILPVRNDIYRKPRPGAWQLLQDLVGSVDNVNSFFVGDAAGRAGLDHSACDFHFALNCGLNFQLPESYFLGRTVRLPIQAEFNPGKLRERQLPKLHEMESLRKLKETPGPTAVILIGPPGSGKSYVSRVALTGWEYINQDTLKTKQRVLAMIKRVVPDRKSFVVDRQHATREDRGSILKEISAASGSGYRKVGVWLDVPKAYAEHCNIFRELNHNSAEHRGLGSAVPPMVIHKYYKDLEPPSDRETFDEIVHLPLKAFNPGPFESSEAAQLFYSMLRYTKTA